MSPFPKLLYLRWLPSQVGWGSLPKFIQIRKEERHVWTRHFEDTVMHLPRKFTFFAFSRCLLLTYIRYIYIYVYTYLPCMSACFGLVCISHQFFTWSQDLFIWYHMCYLQTYVQKNWRLHSGSRSVFGSASTETYARDGSSLGLPHQNWVWNWVKPWKRSDNRQKKTIAPKYLLRLVFWFERYLSVFDLSIRSHLHLQGEVRSFAPILPSQQQLTGRSKQLDSMV